jgi:hypothetical protein
VQVINNRIAALPKNRQTDSDGQENVLALVRNDRRDSLPFETEQRADYAVGGSDHFALAFILVSSA